LNNRSITIARIIARITAHRDQALGGGELLEDSLLSRNATHKLLGELCDRKVLKRKSGKPTHQKHGMEYWYYILHPEFQYHFTRR